jgi:hypothetical protein
VTVALLAVIVVLVLIVGWLLRSGPERGGMIDLTARGELDLDWDDACSHGGCEPRTAGPPPSTPPGPYAPHTSVTLHRPPPSDGA